MEVRKYIPKTEAWRERRAQEVETLFWMHVRGIGQEIVVPEDPMEMTREIDEDMDLLGIDPEIASEIRIMVSREIESGPAYGRGKLLISYGDENTFPAVAYL